MHLSGKPRRFDCPRVVLPFSDVEAVCMPKWLMLEFTSFSLPIAGTVNEIVMIARSDESERSRTDQIDWFVTG
jgi:hypothetical protein